MIAKRVNLVSWVGGNEVNKDKIRKNADTFFSVLLISIYNLYLHRKILIDKAMISSWSSSKFWKFETKGLLEAATGGAL